jgi:polar amino acid transport system substrate-binding protein
MKTGVWLISAIILAAVVPCPAHAEDIRVGVAVEPYPPFEEKDAAGRWVGFEIDLLDAVCAEVKATCKLVEIPWDGIIPALEAGKLDVIWSSMTITQARAKVVDFTDSYYFLPSVIIGPKSEAVAIDFSNPASVKGKIIGAGTGSNQLAFLKKYFGPTMPMRSFGRTWDVCAALLDGDIDLAMEDALEASECLSSDGGKELEIKAEAPSDPSLGSGVGAALRKSDTKLREQLNAAIKTLRTNGTYQRLARKYFNFDPYGK